VPIGTIGAVVVAGGGVAGALYLGYKYFVEPGNTILAQYRYILEDIYNETKKFLEENAKLDPPIYGLTQAQEAIIEAKEEAAERIRPDVESVLKSRGIDVNGWVYAVIEGIVIVFVAKEVVPKILDLLWKWHTQKAESESVQSHYGHLYEMFEIIANEMAYSGKLNIASGFLSNMQSLYSSYAEPAINAQISYYNSLLPGLAPGSLEYIVCVSMLNYLTFEISASGIMGALWQFWLPPIL
jgi:hypothetical protein